MSILLDEQHDQFAASAKLEQTIKVILRRLDYGG
jgi:hypothetical protein